MNMIPYGRQVINQEDIDAVLEVLRSDFLTQGPKVQSLRKWPHIAGQCAIAVNSGTSALHIACRALDVGPEICMDHAHYFRCQCNCALYCGAGWISWTSTPYLQSESGETGRKA